MTEKATPMGERMATVESWVINHEKVCGDRYRVLMKVISGGVSIIVAVAGWGLLQVYQNQTHQLDLLQELARRPPAASPTVSQP